MTREWKDEPFWGSVASGPLQDKVGQKHSKEEPAAEKQILPSGTHIF